MCLNLFDPEKSNLKYATKDKVCYKVLRIQKNNNEETFHAPYYVEFEYELNKKYNTEIKPHGYPVHAKNTLGIYCRLNFEIAHAINQYYDRTRTFRYITCGFHTIKSLKDADRLKRDFEADSFHRRYKVFKCVIPKGSWYYEGFDDLFNYGFVSDSLIVKREIECV